MEKLNANVDEKDKSPNLEHGTKSNWKHMFLMTLGCLAPVGVALLLTQMGYTGAASYLLFLLCPIMHLLMMRNMNKDNK